MQDAGLDVSAERQWLDADDDFLSPEEMAARAAANKLAAQEEVHREAFLSALEGEEHGADGYGGRGGNRHGGRGGGAKRFRGAHAGRPGVSVHHGVLAQCTLMKRLAPSISACLHDLSSASSDLPSASSDLPTASSAWCSAAAWDVQEAFKKLRT